MKVFGTDGALLVMNPAGLSMIEADFLEQVRGEPVEEIVASEHRDAFRALSEKVLRGEPGTLEFERQAGSLSEARKVLAEKTMDIGIFDLGFPDGYGGDLIKELRASNPRAQALVLSASEDRAKIARAVESGAAGGLHKSAGMD